MNFEASDNRLKAEDTEQKLEPVLLKIEEIETGKPASFIAYHGTDKLFVEAKPDNKHAVVFYADTPETAATYPWAHHRNGVSKEFEKVVAEDPEAFLAARLLHTKEYEALPSITKKPTPDHSRILPVDEVHSDQKLLTIQEKLASDVSLL
ncbi:MAG: hypothetical protein Q7R64_03210, partial [bacterium]|nr:hypothetical protein [bacterium]